MAIAISLQEFLNSHHIEYDVLSHPYTTSSMSSAEAAKISGDMIAKCVVLEDDNGYVMAIVPATHHLDIGRISRQFNRHLGLATEQELASIFSDCDLGAIPPIGDSYGMKVIVDDSLDQCPDIYFEAGDHTDMIHVRSEEFRKMTHNAHHGHFSHHL
ncbi:MAG: YbaK/EbsC family protein [Gammaproteobacteria bacterium]|jgi:Ala-tRNA(Pro) deacylase